MSMLWARLHPYVLRMAGAALALSVAAMTVLAFGWGLKGLIDHGFGNHSADYLDHALLFLLVVIIVLALSSYARFYLVHDVSECLVADLRRDVYARLVAQDASFFDTHATGDQVLRLNADMTVLQTVLTSSLPFAFRNVLTALGGACMLFVVSPGMMGLMFLAAPLVIAPVLYLGRRVRSRSRDAQDGVGHLSAFAQETLQGLSTIQSFVYEPQAQARFSSLVEAAKDRALKHVRLRAFLTAFAIAAVFGAVGIVLWRGGHAVLQGSMTAGDLSAFVFYAVVTASAAGALAEATGAFHQAMGAWDRLASALALPLAESADTAKTAAPLRGRIEFKDVSFVYPDRTENALDLVSFTVEPGEFVALVGPSGAGKSTILHLLQRFIDPTSGQILIDGVDIQACDTTHLRRSLGLVAQETVLFSMTVADNIHMGRIDASDEEVRRAGLAAQADDFIKALPLGYGTVLGEGGRQLSGGQRQRIDIARVILKDPPVLLLDEATASLDAASENDVLLALRQAAKGRTVISIAHRLSTVLHADRVIVMDGGRVVAAGAHDVLMKEEESLYAHLAGLQMRAKA